MSLGIVYHCASDHSPWIISFGSSDPTGTARGDLFKSVLLLYIYINIFGHTVLGVLDSELIIICYCIEISLYFGFI